MALELYVHIPFCVKKCGYCDFVSAPAADVVQDAYVKALLQTFDGKELYPTDLEKIARLGFGLASNHAFVDGNKRIGAMMTQLLLKWNGYDLTLHTGELADMFIAIADGTAKDMDLLDWIHAHLR